MKELSVSHSPGPGRLDAPSFPPNLQNSLSIYGLECPEDDTVSSDLDVEAGNLERKIASLGTLENSFNGS